MICGVQMEWEMNRGKEKARRYAIRAGKYYRRITKWVRTRHVKSCVPGTPCASDSCLVLLPVQRRKELEKCDK